MSSVCFCSIKWSCGSASSPNSCVILYKFGSWQTRTCQDPLRLSLQPVSYSFCPNDTLKHQRTTVSLSSAKTKRRFNKVNKKLTEGSMWSVQVWQDPLTAGDPVITFTSLSLCGGVLIIIIDHLFFLLISVLLLLEVVGTEISPNQLYITHSLTLI